MKTKIVKIGNSQGVRIPKPLIEQTGLTDEVEISIQGDTLVISLAHKPREGWNDSFQAMAEADDDYLLDDTIQTSEWDEEEWEW
jgi:antitoxin MazE